jgi:hypothetical protein
MDMTGWKTKLGAGGMIATGLGMCLGGLSAGGSEVGFNPDWVLFGEGIAMINLGIATLGIGHKIEKAK